MHSVKQDVYIPVRCISKKMPVFLSNRFVQIAQ